MEQNYLPLALTTKLEFAFLDILKLEFTKLEFAFLDALKLEFAFLDVLKLEFALLDVLKLEFTFLDILKIPLSMLENPDRWSLFTTCKAFYLSYKNQVKCIMFPLRDRKLLNFVHIQAPKRYNALSRWRVLRCIEIQGEEPTNTACFGSIKSLIDYCSYIKNNNLSCSLTKIMLKGVCLNNSLPKKLSKLLKLEHLFLDDCEGKFGDISMLLKWCPNLHSLYLRKTHFYDSSLNIITPIQPSREFKELRLEILTRLQSNMDNAATPCLPNMNELLACNTSAQFDSDPDLDDEFYYDLVLTSFKEMFNGGLCEAKLYCIFPNLSNRHLNIEVIGFKYGGLLNLNLGHTLPNYNPNSKC